MMAVGVGWETGEFAALGANFEHRGGVLDESIEIYRQAWENSDIDFDGRHFQIHDVSMDLKPIQPRIPIWYGGMSKIAAKRAVRSCEGFYPMLLDGRTQPADLDFLRTVIRQEADKLQRDLSDFTLGAYCQIRLTQTAQRDSSFKHGRPILTGNAEQIVEDLARLAGHGYEHITVQFDCPGGTANEHVEQTEQFALEVLPQGRSLAAAPITH